MASSIPFLLLIVGLFTTIVGAEDCSMYGGKYGWCGSGEFCCGSCGQAYCCSDPHRRVQARVDCLLKEGFKNFGRPPRRDSVPVDVLVPIVVVPILAAAIIVLIICWVCPCCCLHKRFRSPRPVNATTTVVATQYLPQPGVQYQPLLNNPSYGGQPMPSGPFRGQPYQQAAGPGYPVPLSGRPASDYTSAQPAYNPAFLELQRPASAGPVQS